MNHFNRKTFQYFDLAQKNRKKKEWFVKNKTNYEENVKAPFSVLIDRLRHEIDLPGINIAPKGITRPTRPSNRAPTEGWVKSHTHITLWEKRSSLFEWNPGIHIQFGEKEDDNFYGLGLYMVSSRQQKKLRQALVEDTDTIRKVLKNKKLRSAFPEFLGDRYKRFPKGYAEDHPAAELLWHKQFYIGRNLSRKEVCDPKLFSQMVKDIRAALPFFAWVRNAVGVYSNHRM